MTCVAAVGDIHLDRDLAGHLRPALEHAATQASLLLVAGDLTRHGALDEAQVVAEELAGLPIPVVITAYADKSFTFVMKTPPATILIKKAAGIQKGSPKPHTDKVGKITRKQAEEIATTKRPDLTAADMEAAVRTIAGSARSMGITVEGL